MKEGPFGPNSELIQAVPEEYRAQVLKELEEAGLTDIEEDVLKGLDLDDLPVEFDDIDEQDQELESTSLQPAVTLRIPRGQKAYVKKFNDALENVGKNEDNVGAHLMLWQWYLRCQQHVANLSSVIPDDVWQTLWNSVLMRAYRPKHVIVLAKDMQAAEIELDGGQKVAYMEALFSENDAAKALTYWKEKQSEFTKGSEFATKYWPLGVRLYAALGRPMNAQEVAFKALRDGTDTTGQILVPVISAWANSKSPKASTELWVCYLHLRSLMGDRMSVDLYQRLSSAVLKSEHADMALAIFKDMITSQEQAPDDSTEIYRRAAETLELVQSRAVTEEHINRIGLSALMIFPKRFHNKFFFGSWIKMLIGRGEIGAAATVVELMYERGVKLDAKHMNGIIGAWLREGSLTSRKKAEGLAWSMINARVDLVKGRRIACEEPPASGPDSGTSTQTIEMSTRNLPLFLRRASPPATVETFSILLLYYTRRSDTVKADELTQIMTGPADIRPNSFIMNHWLYNALRSSDIQGVWDKYESLKDDIKPDLETFAALWDTGIIQYDPYRPGKVPKFPTARCLFREMAAWLATLNERQLDAAKEDFSKDLYDTIIRCFQYSSDANGLICAMHGLKAIFNVYPDANTTRIVVLLVSRKMQQVSPTGPARMAARRGELQKSLRTIAQILDAVADERKVKLMQQGVDLKNLDPKSEVSKQAQLDILSDFLLTIMQRTIEKDGDAKNSVKTVAAVMKVDTSAIDFSPVGRDD